jgi:hypothetical protein|tara:strand:+ start:149 stop:313 length:165 start_codon:yes stop_codon:yes gene_type:complete
MDVIELIDSIKAGDNISAKQSFDTAIGQKLTAALDAKKIEIASQIGQPKQTEEE